MDYTFTNQFTTERLKMDKAQIDTLQLVIADWLLSQPEKATFFARELAEEISKRTGCHEDTIFNDVLRFCGELVYIGTLWASNCHKVRDTAFTVGNYRPFLLAARRADENATAA